MIYFLILLSYALIAINFGAPLRVSNIPDVLVVLEHTLVLYLCHGIVKRHFHDTKNRRRYYIFFLVSYCISILYLYTEWGDKLFNTFSTGWDAFDPIKYYSMAAVSIKNGYLFEDMKMFPVSFVYYVIMKIFGMNPLVPLFFNEVVFVYAICILTKYMNTNTPQHLKYYSWLLLIPEVICYNVTSSKDILCCLCATIVFVKSATLLKKGISRHDIFILAFFFIILVLARTSLAMASVCGVLLMAIFSRRLSKKQILLIGVALSMAVGVFVLSSGRDSSADNIANNVEAQVSGDVSGAAQLNGQSANSFAQKIIPHNTVEYIVFGFIRSICYVVIDPRFIKAPLTTMLPMDGLTMLICVDYTTLVMCIASVYIFFWLLRKYKKEDDYVKDVFLIVALYWYAVGTFNPMMIHVRYRIVYDIFFFAIAIRAYLMRKKNKKRGFDNTCLS